MPAKKTSSPPQPPPAGNTVEFGMAKCFVTEAEMRQQIACHKWPFYVYALCDPLGCIFYVGKGQSDRIFAHVTEADKGGAGSKCETIRLLGSSLRYAVLLSCSDEGTALVYEAGVIDRLWDAATLTNIRRESVEAAIEAAERLNDPFTASVRSLQRTFEIIREMEAQTERAALRLVRQYPHLRNDLFPAGAVA